MPRRDISIEIEENYDKFKKVKYDSNEIKKKITSFQYSKDDFDTNEMNTN